MPTSNSGGDVRWIGGLRAVASILVVNAHVSRSVAPILLSPAYENGDTMFWQLPFIRNIFMGRPSIAVFVIVSGYVNSLRTIRLTREGQADIALPLVAKTTFRRTGRFVLPAVAITTLTWLLCQLGGFRLAEIIEWAWIRDTSPLQSTDTLTSFYDLFMALGKTWTDGLNLYDPVQWTLVFLLRGSMLVYLTLFGTAYVRPKYRYGLYMLMYSYYFWMGDALVGTNIYVGLILAEMSNDPHIAPYMANPGVGLMSVAIALVLAGLYAISYPEEDATFAGWSTGLITIGGYIFPVGAEYSRVWPAVGSQMIVLGLFFVPFLKELLSVGPLVWMGEVSFAIYIIHGPLMRSLLTYMVFGWSERPEFRADEGTGKLFPVAWVAEYNNWVTGLAIVIFYLVLYRLASLWVRWVDPACGRVAKRLETLVFVDEAKEKPAQVSLPS